MRRTLSVRTALLLVMAAPGIAVAQDIVLSGTVTDTTGLVLPGVTVEARSTAGGGAVRTATTDNTGRYALSGLQPGAYDVTFTLPGFHEVVRSGVEVSAGATTTLDYRLRTLVPSFNVATHPISDAATLVRPASLRNLAHDHLDDGETLLIGDVLDARDGIADGSANCPTVRVMNNVPDQAALAQVFADPNCFTFQELAPGGFTPQFGGVVSDASVVAGLRQTLENGVIWDASASYGAHESDFFFNNTVNASLGLDTPREFDPGLYRQEEVNLNFDVSHAVTDIVNIAAGTWNRSNVALYGDLELRDPDGGWWNIENPGNPAPGILT